MKRVLPVLLIVAFAAFLAACDSMQPEAGDATPAAEIETSETVTGDPGATLPATEPDVIVIEPVATAEVDDSGSGLPDGFDGSQPATLDTTGLPGEAVIQIVPATPYDNSQPPSPIGLPEHVRVDFTSDSLEPDTPQPVLYVIPTADYAALWEASGDMGVSGTLAGLQALIREQLDPFPEAGIPVLPVERVGSAFNDLAVQGRYIEYPNVSGLRFVGRFVDAANPVTNEGLTYVFQGFTNDGQYYVSFLYPIATPTLPADSAAADSAELELFSSDLESYMAERVSALNSLSDSDWTPSLSALDNVLASLQIPAPQTTDVVVVAPSLTGQTWQWVRTVGASGEAEAADPARYTITFNDDGTAVIVADCNTVQATYTTDESYALSIVLGPGTRVACPPDSQDQMFLDQLSAARAYGATSTDLSIEIAEDRTTMQLAVGGEVAEGISTDVMGDAFLTSGVWQWISTDDPLGSILVTDPSRYTLQFNTDGTAAIQADCNNVLASYTATEDGAMSIVLGPSTLAACAPDSRDAEFLQSLSAVVFYANNGGGLSMEMMADGGVLNFALAGEQVIEPEVEVVANDLAGPVWQWTNLQQLDGETAVADPSRYTITFADDGTAAIQADCNGVGATYQSGSDGSLSIALGAGTLAFCGDTSQDQVFLGGLGVAQGYAVADGVLTITLQNENGVMSFTPAN